MIPCEYICTPIRARRREAARFRASHPETIVEFRPRAEAALSFVDETVKDQPFLVGDHCTIADIGCWGRMVFMSEGGFEIANWPHLEAWARRLKAMPGFTLPYDLIPSKDREFDPVLIGFQTGCARQAAYRQPRVSWVH